jgi:hypothetical protein
LQVCARAHEPIPEEAKLENAARQLIEADERQVASCLQPGSVAASRNPNPILSAPATRRVKADLRHRAAAQGATHIAWLYSRDSTAAALAYGCPQG